MRDVLVLMFTIGASITALFRPWMGVIALAILAYTNMGRYSWGIMRTFPGYQTVFIATFLGLILSASSRQPFPWTRETCLFLFLMCWFALTTFISPDYPDVARHQLIKVLKVYIGIFPMFWLINDLRKMRWLLFAISLSFGLIGLKNGVFALVSGFQFRIYGPDNTFYGDNNDFALALNMMLPLFLLCYREVENQKMKFLFLTIFFFSVCAVISSWSRGGLLTLCVVLTLLVMKSKRKLMILPLLGMSLIFLLTNIPTAWFERMHTISTFQEDSSAMARIGAWEFAFERFKESPLLGGGFETFLSHSHDVHNAYLEILAEHGFIALILWLLLLFGTMHTLGRLARISRDMEGFEWVPRYAFALRISLIAYASGSLFLGTAYWEIMYQLIGFCVLIKVFLRRAAERPQVLSP